jgi:hypothetical protein
MLPVPLPPFGAGHVLETLSGLEAFSESWSEPVLQIASMGLASNAEFGHGSWVGYYRAWLFPPRLCWLLVVGDAQATAIGGSSGLLIMSFAFATGSLPEYTAQWQVLP